MAYIKDEEINALRSKADIVEIISGYLNVTAKGKNFVAVCPFHDDHSPSLVISRERQIFNCFTCQTGGNVFSFIMKYENVSFPEAVSIVADKIGFNLSTGITRRENIKKGPEYEIYDFATKYYANNLLTSFGTTARKYLEKRGITEETIKEFNIGLASDSKDTFYELSKSKNWNAENLTKLGLLNNIGGKYYDVFINRIVFPIENVSGDVVAFTGRIYNGEDNTAKYLNTKETEIFKKGEILFNYHNSKKHIKEKRQVILVEGNMDAIKLSSKGFKNVVALMGVAISEYQIQMLARLKVPIILMLDNDEAGLKATLKNGELLKKDGLKVDVVRLQGAKDPDEYLEKFGIEAMQSFLDHPISYLDFKINHLKENKNMNSVEDVKTFIDEVVSSLNDETDLTKELITSKISKDYNIDLDVLRKMLKRADSKDKKIPEVKPALEKKRKRKYDLAVSKILYYMLNDKKYAQIFKKELGYFKEKKERMLADEIIYYIKTYKTINVADFTTYIMDNKEMYEYLQEILNLNYEVTLSDDEYGSCIKVILNVYINDKVASLKRLIKTENDINKQVELTQKLADIKKEV